MKMYLFFLYLLVYLLINSIILLLLDLNYSIYLKTKNGSFVDLNCFYCPRMQVALDKSVC